MPIHPSDQALLEAHNIQVAALTEQLVNSLEASRFLDEARARIAELEQQLAEATTNLVTVTDQLTSANSQITGNTQQYVEELQRANDQIATLTAQLSTPPAPTSDGYDLQQLRQQVDTLNAQLAAQQSNFDMQIAALQNGQAQAIQEAVAGKDTEIASLYQQLADLQRRYDELNAGIDSLQGQ